MNEIGAVMLAYRQDSDPASLPVLYTAPDALKARRQWGDNPRDTRRIGVRRYARHAYIGRSESPDVWYTARRCGVRRDGA